MSRAKRVVISAAGVASAAGLGMESLVHAVAEKRSLAKSITLFDTCGFPTPDACEVPGLDPRKLGRTPKDAKVLARASVVALAAVSDLLTSLPKPFVGDSWRAGFFLGVGLEQSDHRDLLQTLAVTKTRGGKVSIDRLAESGMSAMNPLSSLRTLPNLAMAHVAMKLGDAAPRGANGAYSPFDAAAIEAVAAAFESILRNESDVALAGGVDSLLSVFGLTMLHRLGMTGPARKAGEGGALFVIEEGAHAIAAGRTPLAEIEGFGSACDGAGVGNPGSAAAVLAIQSALGYGATKPAALDVAVLSGTDQGGKAPDEMALETVVREASSTRKLNRPPARRIFPRTVFGECGAGSGALGIAVALGEISAGRAARALVTGTAFGGSYAAIVLRRWVRGSAPEGRKP